MILHWAITNGLAFGSFERYLIHMAHRLADRDCPMTLVIGDKLCKEARTAFSNAPLTLITLPIEEVKRAENLRRVHGEVQPALTHFHFASFGGELVPAAEALSSATILTDHASTTMGEHRLRHLYRGTAKWRKGQPQGIDHIIAVSNYVRQRILNWQSADPAQVTTVYNGVDLASYAPMDQAEREATRAKITPRKTGPYWVGFIGQLAREKGLHSFLKASQRLRDEDATFVIIGDGPLRQQAEQAARTQPNLLYLGQRSDVPTLLPALDLIVVPSHMQEAFGLVAAEALACGVPALVANSGGLPEVIGATNQCGGLTRQTSSKQIAQDIRAFMARPDQASLSQAARQRAEDMFALTQQIDQTLGIYDQYLPSPLLAKSPDPRQNPIGKEGA